MAHQRRMTARNINAEPLRTVQFSDRCDDAHSDADALIIRQCDNSREAAMVFPRDQRQRRAEMDRHAAPHREVTPDAGRERPA